MHIISTTWHSRKAKAVETRKKKTGDGTWLSHRASVHHHMRSWTLLPRPEIINRKKQRGEKERRRLEREGGKTSVAAMVDGKGGGLEDQRVEAEKGSV